MNMNEYFQQLNNNMAAEIDDLIDKTRKDVHEDIDQIEKEIELIEQGYSAEEVLEMTKRK